MSDCGALDELVIDGRQIACQLDADHGGFLHAWSHRLHGGDRQGFAVWPTEEGRYALKSGLITREWLHGDHADAMRLELNSR